MNQNRELARLYEGRNGLSLDELISAGNTGLREAIKRFDPERGERLSVSSGRWIERSIKKASGLGRSPTAKEISAIYPKRLSESPSPDCAPADQ
jgi:DNA-directed RNA polymerase sigma subunit (sigma70/sigma32)